MIYEQYQHLTWVALVKYLESGRCDKALSDICKRYGVQAHDVLDRLEDCLE